MSSRIPALDPATTQGKTKDTLDAIQAQLGIVPNLYRVVAHSPATLEGLVALAQATARGTLRAPVRAALALTVAEANGCDYCLSAHTVLGKLAGLDDAAMTSARDAASSDAKTAALLRFASQVVQARGRADLAEVRAAGASDAEVLEVIANVVVNVFTNYVNLVAGTELDFPAVEGRRVP